MEDYLEGLVMASGKIDAHLRGTVYLEMCHGINVSNLATAMAEELGEGEEFCTEIAIAGLLHDLGKLKVAKYLYSDGREALGIEQMKYLRMHTIYACNTLRAEHYPERILQAVYYHHENYDGSGYPDCLKGEDIPWMARILRTCDVFAALTSDRSYRRAFDLEAAVQIMIDEVADYDMKAFLAIQNLLHSERFRKMDQLQIEITPLQKTHLPMFIQEAERISQ